MAESDESMKVFLLLIYCRQVWYSLVSFQHVPDLSYAVHSSHPC